MTSPRPEQGWRSSLDAVRHALEPRGGVRNRSDTDFSALCPVHDDKHASLSVTWTDRGGGGRVLLNCHGCSATAQDITDALGMTVSDLFDEPLRPRENRVGRSPSQRTAGKRRGRLGALPAPIAAPSSPDADHQWSVTATYPYTDARGHLVQEVVREECSCGDSGRHKQFRQQWVKLGGKRVRRKPVDFVDVLYRLPEVCAAVEQGRPVWLLEGEKDVNTAQELGLVATTNAQGALSFPPGCSEYFAGATVHVVLDRDDAGYARGVDLVSLLAAVDAQVQLLLPATDTAKADFTDHVEDGKWCGDDEFGGLVHVDVTEVAAHAEAAKVRAKAGLVERANAEAQAWMARAHDANVDVDDVRAKAQRWARESEIRFEPIAELVETVQVRAAAAGTEWALRAAEDAVAAARAAKIAAVAAHTVAGIPFPPSLHDDQDQPSCVRDRAERRPDLGSPDAVDDTTERKVGEVGPFTAAPTDSRRRGLSISAPTYRVADGSLVEIVVKDGVERAKLVLGIDARVVEMEYLEGAVDVDVDRPVLQGREVITGNSDANPPAPQVLSAVVVGYVDPASGESMRMRVEADDFRDGTWIESLPGPPAFDSRPAGIAKVRDALRIVAADEIVRTVRFRSTGWRRDDAGHWFFVHAGGGIDQFGSRPAPVLLSGPLARYDLPAPITDPVRLRRAFLQDSASMLTRLPDRVGAPLLGHVWRSALGPNPWVLLLVGSPGSYKTSVASLAMHHWGELWDRRKPASSMSGNGDTLNALRIKLNSAKDALYWADDVAPTRDWAGAQKALEEFSRLVHNGEQRSRSTRDGLSVLDGTAPRASAVVTSEVMPRAGSSGGARTLPVPLRAEEIDLSVLVDYDRDDSRHGRALLMASFLQWLAGDLDDVRASVQRETRDFATQLRDGGEDDRRAEATGAVWGGWIAMTRFLVDVGALGEDERMELLDLACVGLTNALGAASDPDLPSSTGGRVRELLAHALRTGVAYVDDVRTGDAPEFPLASRLGWRRVQVGDGDLLSRKYREETRGLRLGYVLTDPGPRDGEPQLMIESAALEQVLKAAGGAMADSLQLDRGTALRALYDEGHLIAEERTGKTPRYTVQRTIHCEGRRQRVTALRLWSILGGEDDLDDGDPWEDGPDAPSPDDGGNAGDAGPAPDAELWTLFGPDVPTSASAPSRETADEAQTAAVHSARDESDSVTEQTVSDSSGPSSVDPEREPVGDVGDPYLFTDPVSPATAELLAPESVEAPPAEPADTERVASPRSGRRDNAAAFTAPAVVVDVDGIWFADGTTQPLPEPLNHVGHVVELVHALGLGVAVSQWQSQPGQVWIGDALAERFGIDTNGFTGNPRGFAARLRTQTAALELVTGATADGWQLGGGRDDEAPALSPWTRVWRGNEKSVWVAVPSAMNRDDLPILRDRPRPAVLARRLSLFAGAIRFPWMISAAATGIDLMLATRAKDQVQLFAPSNPVPPAMNNNTEADLDWSRVPTAEESAMRFVHAYDRGGSHAAGIASLELGIGAPQHYPDGCDFDAKLPGYWLIDPVKAGDWRYPNPLNPAGLAYVEPYWVSTPTLALAVRDLEYSVTVREAYVWHQHSRILDPWYERIRDARTALDTDDPDEQIARDLVKAMYTRTIGMLGSHEHMAGRRGYAPERRHHIVAKARANILRKVIRIGLMPQERWPVAISNDTVLYVSDDPDPIGSWPGAVADLGRGLGKYRWEGSATLEAIAPYLTGRGFRGKDVLTTTWSSEH